MVVAEVGAGANLFFSVPACGADGTWSGAVKTAELLVKVARVRHADGGTDGFDLHVGSVQETAGITQPLNQNVTGDGHAVAAVKLPGHIVSGQTCTPT